MVPLLECLLRVKFLATFLARISQHEAAVLANKFPNLHLYGCWWYCNNPSMIKEVRRGLMLAVRVGVVGVGRGVAAGPDPRAGDLYIDCTLLSTCPTPSPLSATSSQVLRPHSHPSLGPPIRPPHRSPSDHGHASGDPGHGVHGAA